MATSCCRLEYSMKAPYVAIVAGALLAGCSGPGFEPSNASYAPQAADILTNGGGPCAHSTGWSFGGPCKAVTLQSGTVSVGALGVYRTLSVHMTLSRGTQANGQILAVHDATGESDITGTLGGKTFPPLMSSTNPIPMLYLAGYNTGSAFTFNTTPKLVIDTTTSGYNVHHCELDVLSSNNTWTALSSSPTLAAKSITFAPVSTK